MRISEVRWCFDLLVGGKQGYERCPSKYSCFNLRMEDPRKRENISALIWAMGEVK